MIENPTLDQPIYVQREHIEYPDLTMFQMVERMGKKYPSAIAYEFQGSKTTYRKFVEKIEQAARAFYNAGLQKGDVVTICMPNTPQAMICFYALNRIGAVCNMIHPLSALKEITFYLNFSNSRMILTMDMFCQKVEDAIREADHPVRVLVARIQDELNPALALAYTLATGRQYLKYPNTPHASLWSSFVKTGVAQIALPPHDFDPQRTSVILYSGGTTGTPKGICLSDRNLNVLGLQAGEAIGVRLRPPVSMLSCMPMFHGFGLGINIHAMVIHGGTCILMPNFNGKSYAQMLVKKKPNLIAGVPTIFEALLHIPELENADLSFLMGMFCGGDSLSIELKKKVDEFLAAHKATIQVREGYGLTECVTASCLTPRDTFKEGSIGIPFPDTIYCIVKPGTDEVLPAGEEGEIILTSPSLMLKYLDNPEETAKTLRTLSDGRTWLYTGDLGHMDEEGYVYFRQRMKRMIITNGYNVYPGQLENIIDSLPEVSYSCVIGVKDPRRMQRVQAYVVLRDGFAESEEIRQKIMNTLEQHIARYALPKKIEFRKELPKTVVGKVAYRKLEDEANAQQEAQAKAE